MQKGLVTSLIGAVVFLAGAVLLPWQRFELAQVAPDAAALGVVAWIGVALGGLLALVAAFGLATRRWVAAARALLVGSLVLTVGLVVAWAARAGDLHLMAHESVVMGPGFVVAVLGLLVLFAGAGTALLDAPTWDEATPVVRLRARAADGRDREHIVYEPRRVLVARELERPELGATTIVLTPEAEVGIVAPAATRIAVDGSGGRTRRPGAARLAAGDRAVVEVGAVELHIDYVRQAREAPRQLVLGSEAVALALGALLVCLATGVASVLGSGEEPKRLWPDAERREAVITALTEDQRAVEDVDVAIETALLERAPAARAAGGEEGRFGDPAAPPARPTKVPPRPGRMVERLDPRAIGLLEVVTDPKVDRAIADVLADDGTFAARLAVATAGSDDAWSLGLGVNGLSIIGDGDGGPGDGVGRLLGQDPVDDGPGADRPRGPAVALGPRDRKKVPQVAMPTPAVAGEHCRRAAIESVVRRRAGVIRACYEQRLQVDGRLQGKLAVRWTIGLDGAVASADAVTDTLRDDATRQCVLRAVRTMRFPAPEGGLCVVQWPFVFTPG